MAQRNDEFQQAASLAEAKTGQPMWSIMAPAERARLIYSSLRRIDAERVVSLHFTAGPTGRFRISGENTKRVASA
jgi:hypothetical protein